MMQLRSRMQCVHQTNNVFTMAEAQVFCLCTRALGMQAEHVVAKVLEASYPLLPTFGPVEVVASLHALARLHIQPPQSWLYIILARADCFMHELR